MFKLKRKGKILTTIGTTLTMIAIKSQCYATEGSSIGTAEVTEATENIKRVITSIAMPLRWSFNICKYSCCSFEDDC